MNKSEEISKLIANEFDSRMETSVISFIIENGMDKLKLFTEQDINKIKENNFMSEHFLQGMVRTAVKICKTYTPVEIMVYVHTKCCFSPFPNPMTLYKEDFTDEGWMQFCYKLSEDEKVSEINILVIKNNYRNSDM